MKQFAKRLLILLPVAAAITIVIILIMTRPGPVKQSGSEAVRPLRVIETPTVALRPRMVGYGLAEPSRIWRAVAEVKGTLVSVHPQLKAGAFIETGTVLLKINPADYELAVARLKGRLAKTRAKLAELAVEGESKNASLKIEERSLALAQASLQRLLDLLENDIVPPDQVDREQRNVLQQQQAIQQLENDLALIPARRQALNATLAVHQANLEQAELDLARTVIKTPFDCRLGAG